MSLPEDLRQDCLQALGIDSYFPRYRLPAAPEPVPCEWPESWLNAKAQETEQVTKTPGSEIFNEENSSADPVEPVSSLAPERKSATTAPETRQAIRTEAPVARAPTSPVPEPGETQQQTRPKKDEVRFQLLCIRVNEGLAVINAMPHLGPNHLSGQHNSLLQNLLSSTGIECGDMLIEEKPFRWPMVQGEHMDNGRAAAALALKAFLEQKFTDWQFSKILVMGEQVVSRIFTMEEGEDVNPVSLDDQSWEVLYTRSLDEMMHSPAVKKETWSIIRKL